jgi:hypothetical protein
VEASANRAASAIAGDASQEFREAGAPTGLDSLADSVRRDNLLGPWLRAAGHLVGWVVVLGLFGSGLARGLWDGWSAPAAVPVASRLAAFQAQGVEAHWLDSSRLGSLLVVTGELKSVSAQGPVPVGRLELTLLDADGRALDHPGVPIGMPLSERVLREGGRGAVEASRRSAVGQLSSLRVTPGAAVRFQAVASGVPVEARRFDIRAMDGSVSEDSPEAGAQGLDESAFGAAEDEGTTEEVARD